jgi:glutamate/tyrosine decarboxylase-like PLP-dependent enzyme
MVVLGERGYLDIARRIFETAAVIRAAVESIPELEVIGDPTFLVAFKSDAVDIYHVNDALKERGWRMNGLQLPPALHFCVTLPNTQPGVATQFAEDLRAAVEYAKDPPNEPPRSGALYAGGVGHGQVEATLEGVLDAMYELAPPD